MVVGVMSCMISASLFKLIMAEAVAVAITIAGSAGVLQSLLQCYKDFHVARDFDRDFETCVLKLDLLQLSVKNWGIAVGLIDETGSPQNHFDVPEPAKENVKAAEHSLKHIKELFEDVEEILRSYRQEPHSAMQAEGSRKVEIMTPEYRKVWKNVSQKLHRTIHREHDQQHPGTVKRGQWAFVDKDKTDRLVNDITILRDELRRNFPPTNRERQLNLYHAEIEEMQLSDKELDVLKDISKSTDSLLDEVVDMTVKERGSGHSYKNFNTDQSSNVVAGDFVDIGQRRSGGGNSYEGIKTAHGSNIMAGNTFGGTNPLEILMRAKASKPASPKTQVPRSDEQDQQPPDTMESQDQGPSE